MVPSRRVSTIHRSGIREVMDLAAGRADVLHLEVGEPDFATPEHIVQAAIDAARAGYTHYTPNKGLLGLRETIVDTVAQRNALSASPEQVVVTAGAVNALFESLAAVTDSGDVVLLPDPGWPNYAMMAAALGLRALPYRLDADHDFIPEPAQIGALLRSTPAAKAIVINSPNNPTGAVYPAEVMAHLVARAEASDTYLISDEAYEMIVFDGEHVSPGRFSTRSSVISIFSMSKTYAMTGWRVGYLIADAALADEIAKISEAAISCATAIAQKASQAALEGSLECVHAMRESYRKRRDIAVSALAHAGLLLTEPHGAFYLLADISKATTDSYAFTRELLASHLVAVAPGETFGSSGSGWVRLSLATADHDLAEGCRRLIQAVEGDSLGHRGTKGAR